MHDPHVSRGTFAGDAQVRDANELAHFDYANKTRKGKPRGNRTYWSLTSEILWRCIQFCCAQKKKRMNHECEFLNDFVSTVSDAWSET